MLKSILQPPQILLVIEEKHVREILFKNILSKLNVKFKTIILQPKEKNRLHIAKDFCNKVINLKKHNPLIIYICLNTTNTPIELLNEFQFLIDIYDPMLGLNKKDEDREIILIQNSQGCFCRDTRIHYFLRKQNEKRLLKKLYFAPDYPAEKIKSKKKNDKAVSVGWLDGIEDNESPLNKFFSACRSQSVEPWIIPSRFQSKVVKKKKNLKKIIPRTYSKYKKTISSFSFGLVQPCWNRQGELLYPKWYLARASSSRIMDYLVNDMTPVIPKYLRFQIWVANKGKFKPIIFDKTLEFNLKIKTNNKYNSFMEFINYHQKKIINVIKKIIILKNIDKTQTS